AVLARVSILIAVFRGARSRSMGWRSISASSRGGGDRRSVDLAVRWRIFPPTNPTYPSAKDHGHADHLVRPFRLPARFRRQGGADRSVLYRQPGVCVG